jgi:hypothetical protein
MKKITDLEVLDIVKTNVVRTYNSETEGYKGKNYRLYAVNDKAFAVHEDSDFHKDFEKGDIHTVNIDVTDNGWSLINHVTFTRVKAHKQHTTEIEAITVENFKPQRMVNPSEYAGL